MLQLGARENSIKHVLDVCLNSCQAARGGRTLRPARAQVLTEIVQQLLSLSPSQPMSAGSCPRPRTTTVHPPR